MPPRRKSIKISVKTEAIEWIASAGGGVPSRAKAHFRQRGWRITASCYRQWWRDRKQILAECGARRRVVGGGRKPLLGTLEDQLMDTLYDKQIRKEKVTRFWIASTALALFQDSRTEEEHEDDPIRFVASDQWVQNFMTQNNLTLRKRTNLTTLSDEVLVDRAVAFMRFLEVHKPEMNLNHTFLMDETAVYFEAARTYTVDEVGSRHVVIRSTGFASMRITVMLAVTASGRKLPPCLIWKRKTRGAIERLGGCYVAFQERAWVDQELLLNWLDWYYLVVTQVPGQFVVWDSMRAHIGKKVKQRCSDKGIKMAVIPGRLTPYLQAGDVGIYKSFKDIMSKLIERWTRSDKVSYTKAGNPRAPDITLVTSWVSQAWKETPLAVVEKSVQACGFNDDSSQWHISKHNVYGPKSRAVWELQEGADTESGSESDASVNSVMETLGDIVIEDLTDKRDVSLGA